MEIAAENRSGSKAITVCGLCCMNDSGSLSKKTKTSQPPLQSTIWCGGGVTSRRRHAPRIAARNALRPRAAAAATADYVDLLHEIVDLSLRRDMPAAPLRSKLICSVQRRTWRPTTHVDGALSADSHQRPVPPIISTSSILSCREYSSLKQQAPISWLSQQKPVSDLCLYIRIGLLFIVYYAKRQPQYKH